MPKKNGASSLFATTISRPANLNALRMVPPQNFVEDGGCGDD
jgi:hypothetical protein